MQVLPKMLAGACEAFNYASCRFEMHKSKEGCARVVAHRELGIEAAYTVEASFLGGTRGAYAGRHFSQQDLLDIGARLCKAIDPWLDEEMLRRTMGSIDADEKRRLAAAAADGVSVVV